MRWVLGSLGAAALMAALTAWLWLVTFGPVGTRSDEHYGRAAAVKYEAWLTRHGSAGAAASGCVPERTGLDTYGPPSYYSCAVDSAAHCLLVSTGITELGTMSRARCASLVND